MPDDRGPRRHCVDLGDPWQVGDGVVVRRIDPRREDLGVAVLIDDRGEPVTRLGDDLRSVVGGITDVVEAREDEVGQRISFHEVGDDRATILPEAVQIDG